MYVGLEFLDRSLGNYHHHILTINRYLPLLSNVVNLVSGKF